MLWRAWKQSYFVNLEEKEYMFTTLSHIYYMGIDKTIKNNIPTSTLDPILELRTNISTQIVYNHCNSYKLWSNLSTLILNVLQQLHVWIHVYWTLS
jgi:hypothetical protein